MPSRPSPVFPFTLPPELAGAASPRRPVVIVGAGPVGLALAIDLALHGAAPIVLEDDDAPSHGSRAICWSQRTLEIFDRLGVGARVVARGVTWQRGKVFHGARMIYAFDLLPEAGHAHPAFVNLQQYLVEEILVERALALGVEIRWRSRLADVAAAADGVTATVDTPAGPYRLGCDWLVAADGVKSAVRRALGLDFVGQVFHDRFLIADVEMKADFPTERWFWFDPPFHPGRSALLHRQADGVWRIDLQLGPDADPELERRPERVLPRLRAMLGADTPFELVWVSVYTFQCRRLARFVHGRVLFAGDAAHQVSPFGARGGNGGIQDADNLAWKLALVVQGKAAPALLASYDAERVPAADENIRHSTRSTDFIAPKGTMGRVLRDAVLSLAAECPFARRLVNSGRLSTPFTAVGSPLATPDDERFAGTTGPGAPCADAPVAGPRGWLLPHLGGGFAGLWFAGADGAVPTHVAAALARLATGRIPVRSYVVLPAAAPAAPGAAGMPLLVDVAGMLAARYDATPGTFYLIRPDQHVAARWRTFDAGRVDAALARAGGAPPVEHAHGGASPQRRTP